MELINHTKLAAQYLGGSPDLRPDLVVGQIVGKALGLWDRAHRFTLQWDAKVPILRERQCTPFGDVAPDIHPLKAGCDVTAVGQVYSPDPKGAKAVEVQVSVGDARRCLQVFGPRRWRRDKRGGLKIGETEPFGSLDMGWAHSFGGRCPDEQGQTQSYLFNPDGQGLIACPQRADGVALPRIEDPDQRICSWRDQPMPINLAAIPKDLPLSLYPDPTPIGQALLAGKKVKLPPGFHNAAHPRFRFQGLAPGTPFGIKGMDTRGGLFGALPELRFQAAIRLGDRHHTLWLEPSQLVFFPETRQVSLTYSAHFAFRWIPRQVREIKLRAFTPSGSARKL